MTGYVIDSSVFGPFFFNDETDVLDPALGDLIAGGECVVPQHWWLEIGNQLLMGLRRGRSDDLAARSLLTEVEHLPISVDGQTATQFRVTFDVASRHGLTVYDAAYLELAIRSSATLVSYDKALRAAADKEGVKLLP